MEHPIFFPVIVFGKHHMIIICLIMKKKRGARITVTLITAAMTL